MEITIVKAEKEAGQKEEDSLQGTSKDKESADDNNLSKRMVKRVNHKGLLSLNFTQSQRGEIGIQESFLKRIRGLGRRIPKHIISLDEKYLRNCLELIYLSASKAASRNIPDNLGFSNMCILSDNLGSLKKRNTYSRDLGKVIRCPLEAGSENVVISPSGEWIVGSISSSKSIMSILNSPLFHQAGDTESEINFGITDSIDTTKSVGSNFMGSTGWLSTGSSQKLVVIGNDGFGFKPEHKRLVSVSSTNSTFSDQSSSSVSAGFIQGMLHCTWKAGFPHYVFSIDDQKEVYVANLFKAESPDDKVFDYMYMFHSISGGIKEHEIHENESNLVGKMRVSTTFSLCPNNSEMTETEFVLFGSDESSLSEMQTSSQIVKKNKGLSKKVVEVFKTSHSSRERTTSSKYVGTSAILENSSWKPYPHTYTNIHNPLGTSNLSENPPPPNLELAAIIVRNHIHGGHKGVEIGGWGLRFLKKTEPSMRNTDDCCSTSMEILVPAGFHGGPRNRNGGPSSLTERWRDSGRCDCGGWDIGCPLTVLNTRPSIKEASLSPQDDSKRDNKKSFDLFVKDSMQGAPVMKMGDIHDGLFLIHFQSTLSALQSLSIAVAIIHTQTPALQPKVYRS